MASLPELPVELWIQLSSHLNYADLACLSRVCRTSYLKTVNHLYQDICINHEDGDKTRESVTQILSLLLQTLLPQPDLGAKIQRATFKFCDTNLPKFGSCVLAWKPSALGWTEADYLQLQKLNANIILNIRDLLQAASSGQLEAFVAGAVSLMPSLEALDLAGQFMSHDSKFVAPLIRNVAADWQRHHSAPLFEHLQSFSCCDWCCSRTFWPSFDAVLALFYLPSLTHLDLVLLEAWLLSCPHGHRPSAAIKKFVLRDSQIRPKWLEFLLYSTHNLEELAVGAVTPYDQSWLRAAEFQFETQWRMYGTKFLHHPTW